VQLDREERARIKAQKKAEAAEPQAHPRRGGAQRKATDIIFLGRGVPAGSTVAPARYARLDVEELLPVRARPPMAERGTRISETALAGVPHGGCDPHSLRHLRGAEAQRRHASAESPHRTLKKRSSGSFENILSKLPVEPPRTASSRARASSLTRKPHVGKAVVLNMDLEGFFRTSSSRVSSVFYRPATRAASPHSACFVQKRARREVMYEGKRQYVTTGPRGLPQAACTSPALSNQGGRLDSASPGWR
jgi:hypothetical protein